MGTQTLGRPAAVEAADVARLRAEIERLQDELAHQIRLNARMEGAVEEFVGTLSHDLKNPLAAIKIGVQGFKRSLERAGAVGLDEGNERLARLDSAVEHAKELIADARAKALQHAVPPDVVQRQPVDLVSVLRDALEPFQAQVGSARLKLSCARSRLMANVDSERIRRGITAVVDNALKFSSAESLVTVGLKRQGESATITCHDEGIGIPAADLPHIGERFYRAENVLGRYRGAGLGLFETTAIVLAHQGHLAVESAEGSGTQLTIRLPLQ